MSDNWYTQISGALDHFEKNGSCPRKSCLSSTGGGACAITSCIPCLIWSCVLRILVCPMMCCSKGASFMCSNNPCTDLTDSCVAKCFTEMTEYRLPPRPKHAASDPRFPGVVARLIAIFDRDRYTAEHYRLCDAMMPAVLPGTLSGHPDIFLHKLRGIQKKNDDSLGSALSL